MGVGGVYQDLSNEICLIIMKRRQFLKLIGNSTFYSSHPESISAEKSLKKISAEEVIFERRRIKRLSP